MPVIETPEQLYNLHRKTLLLVAWKYLQSPEDAEDCLQDAMLRVVRRWTDCDKSKALAWSSMIVRNVALDIHRKRKSRGNYHLHIALEDLIEDPGDTSAERGIVARLTIERGMEQMHPGLRKALNSWADGNRGRSRAQAFRARQKFREIVGGNEN